MALAASLKAIYRGGLPDHGDSAMHTTQAVVTVQILVDEDQWAACWTLALAMGGVVVLGLKDRELPRWCARLSAVLTAFVLGVTWVLAVPSSAGGRRAGLAGRHHVVRLRLRTRVA